METFAALDLHLRRSRQAVTLACLSLALLAAASLAFAFLGARSAREAAARMPVLVVPGAVAGIYNPGLTEESVRAVARYLASLATNYASARSFDERFDELEAYSSAPWLPRLQAARAALRRELDTQNQSRSFLPSPSTESFAQAGPGRFDYSVHGVRTVYASGLAMSTRPCRLRLSLHLGSASDANRLGVAIDAFDLTDDAPNPAGSGT